MLFAACMNARSRHASPDACFWGSRCPWALPLGSQCTWGWGSKPFSEASIGLGASRGGRLTVPAKSRRFGLPPRRFPKTASGPAARPGPSPHSACRCQSLRQGRPEARLGGRPAGFASKFFWSRPCLRCVPQARGSQAKVLMGPSDKKIGPGGVATPRGPDQGGSSLIETSVPKDHGR